MPTRVLARKGRAASAKKGPGAGTTASYTAFAKTGKGARRNSSNSKTKSKSNSKISSLKKSKSLLSGKAQAGKKAKKSSKSILKKMSAKVDLKKIGKKVVKKVLAKKKVAKKGAKKVLTKKSNSTKAKGKVAAAKVAKPAMRSKASSSSSAAPKVNKAKKPKVEEIDLHEAIRRRNIPRIKDLIEVNWSSVRRRRLAKVIEPQGTPLDVAIDMNDFEVRFGSKFKFCKLFLKRVNTTISFRKFVSKFIFDGTNLYKFFIQTGCEDVVRCRVVGFDLRLQAGKFAPHSMSHHSTVGVDSTRH